MNNREALSCHLTARPAFEEARVNAPPGSSARRRLGAIVAAIDREIAYAARLTLERGECFYQPLPGNLHRIEKDLKWAQSRLSLLRTSPERAAAIPAWLATALPLV
jgi:hypothetical protein